MFHEIQTILKGQFVKKVFRSINRWEWKWPYDFLCIIKIEKLNNEKILSIVFLLSVCVWCTGAGDVGALSLL